jgi:Fe-coproporphyrin III synthase
MNRLRRMNARYMPKHVLQPPQWLVLGVNNTCNLHCKMCDVGVNYTQSNFFNNLMASKPVHMPIELFRTIADQAAKYFPSVKLGYAFTEPLIYTHLEESLEYAKRKNLFTSITTNGLALKKWSKVLADNKVKEVNVSLDGPSDVHNFIRGNQYSFTKAIEGIDALAEQSNEVSINIFCVITEWNTTKLVELTEALKGHRISRVGFIHSNFTPTSIAEEHNVTFGLHYPATASNVSDTNMDAMDLEALWAEMQRIKRLSTDFRITFSPEIKSRQLLETYYHAPEVYIGRRCMDAFSNIMIKSNGDVIPAHGRCYNLRVGNLYSENLKEIWNSNVFGEFRQTLSENGGLLPACSRCCSGFIR